MKSDTERYLFVCRNIFLHIQMLHLGLALENTQVATIEEVRTAGADHAALLGRRVVVLEAVVYHQ